MEVYMAFSLKGWQIACMWGGFKNWPVHIVLVVHS